MSKIGRREGPAVPILPSRDIAATLEFYSRLGFETEAYGTEYGFVQRDAIELHYAHTPDHDPWVAAGAAFVAVDDVDHVRAEFVAAGVWATDSQDPPCTDTELHRRWDAGEGLARVTPVEDKPWGIEEFALMDIDNNLLRFGSPD
ncbi:MULTISPECIES: bleomycin resistance protein [Nocardia]|uniref:bleomycin resistance protein n=1 Tax=Nocardia TaxID=1817 RepID=UPI000D69312C|nr:MULTISPECIES: VOC family protein [Nocardia]